MNVLDQFKLDGRIAIVTGGGRGLGFAMAEALAEAGARVAIAELNPELCVEAADKLTQAGHEVIAVQTDVTRRASVEASVNQVVARWGSPDILVNNAGTGYRKQDNWDTPASIPFELVSEENWQFVQDANLGGCFQFSQVVGRLMLDRGKGAIVNVASISGMIGNIRRHNAAYCAAKAGVIMLTRQLAASWAERGIRVNAIAPGYMRTEMGAKALDDPNVKDLLPVMTPMGRAGEPSEMKALAVFLASDASSFITGQCIAVDGGYTLW